MAMPVRALQPVIDPTYGRTIRSRNFDFDGNLFYQFILQQQVARVCEVDCNKISLYRKDLAGNFVPIYRDNRIVDYGRAIEQLPLEIYVQDIDEVDEAAEKAWRGDDLESEEIHGYRHFLKKLCLSRLLHKSFSFDDCPGILMKDLILTPENEATARRIFEQCKVHFVDETNEKHLVQIPMLPEMYFKVALIFDKDFKNVFMLHNSNNKWVLPIIFETNRDGYYTIMMGETTIKVITVSFLDVEVIEPNNTTIRYRAYFLFGLGDIVCCKGRKWMAFDKVVNADDVAEYDTLPILRRVNDLLFGQ